MASLPPPESTAAGPEGSSVRITWREGVLLAAFLGAILLQKVVGNGIQLELLVAAALALPLVLRQRFAPGRKSHLETAAFVLAVLGILVSVPGETRLPGLWLSCAGLVCLARSPHVSPQAWDSRLAWGLLALCCLEVGLLWWLKEPDYYLARVLLLAPLVLECWRRRADSTPWGWRIALFAGALPLLDSLAWIKDASFAPLALALVAGLHSTGWLLSHAVRNKQARRRALKVFFPVVFMGFCYLLAEGAFQVIPNRYKRIVLPKPGNQWHEPGGTYSYTGAIYFEEVGFENIVTWNKHGFWDVDHELSAAPLTSRVLVVGDSYVEGIQVAREALLHRKLAEKLSQRVGQRVEGIGYGCSGWGQTESRVALLEGGKFADGELYPPGLDYSPDVVVLEFLPGNDVYDNSPALKEEVSRQFLNSSSARRYYLAALELRLYFSAMLLDKIDLALRQLDGQQQSIVSDVYKEEPPRFKDLWEQGWDTADREIAAISAACRSRGVRLVVVVFPALHELPVRDETSYPSRRLREICATRGVEYLDLTPTFSAESDRLALYLGTDGHWSPRGHEVAASAVADYLAAPRKK